MGIEFGASPRELPKVMIGGKEYYKDDRLREYRNVGNPHDVISFEAVGIKKYKEEMIASITPGFGAIPEEGGVQHWKCSSCGKVLTYIKDEDEEFGIVSHVTHFDIERSRKDLWLDNGNIEEAMEKRNSKMERSLCEDCFLKVLNESPTLGKLFYVKHYGKFVY